MSKINFKSTSVAILLSVFLVGCSSTTKQESTGQYIDNSAITLKVKSKLATDPDISSFPITVNTYKGVVQLSGFVDSYMQENKAVSIAKSVPGVVDVQDSLIVKRQ
jgi:hyperosmotically inducible protein